MLNRILGRGTDVEESVHADATVDELLEAISNERRRLVVRYMSRDVGTGETVRTDEIADYVAGVEKGGMYDAGERKAVYVALYQTHLPKLVGCGALDKPANHEFQTGPNLEVLHEILEAADDVTGGGSA